MRVALINPQFRLPIDTRTTAHLGLAYLGAVSQKRGDTVRIFDADVEEQSVEDFVREFQPDLIGITANTPQVKQAWRTARACASLTGESRLGPWIMAASAAASPRLSSPAGRE